MGWKGIAFGGCVGGLFGGPFGALFGVVFGHQIEQRLKSGAASSARRSMPFRFSFSRDQPSERRAKVFCACAAAMLAKMAKADGRISRAEIASVEQAFARLGFTPSARAYAIGVFRRAKDDAHTIDEYAAAFAAAVDSIEVRELFYEILWDIARADGAVGANERAILQRIPRALRIRADWYAFFAQAGAGRRSAAQGDLPAAYAVLGASAEDSGETLRQKYRALAKKNHPDALRAQGLPEELVGKATERMGRINAAWATVRAARGL